MVRKVCQQHRFKSLWVISGIKYNWLVATKDEKFVIAYRRKYWSESKIRLDSGQSLDSGLLLVICQALALINFQAFLIDNDKNVCWYQGPNPWVSGHQKQSPMDPNMIWASNTYLVVFQVRLSSSFSSWYQWIFFLLGPCCWYEDSDTNWGTFWGEPCWGRRWIWKASQRNQLEVAECGVCIYLQIGILLLFLSLLSTNSFLIIAYKRHN